MDSEKYNEILSLEELRQKAEFMSEQTQEKNEFLNFKDPTMEQLTSLIHELKIYQIELEMQNNELRRTQASLDKKKIDYQDLFEQAPVGYLLLNSKGIIQDVNLTACKLIQTEKVHLIRHPFSEFVSDEFKILYSQHLKSTKKTRKSRQDHIQIVRDDGYVVHTLIETAVVNSSEKKEELFRLILTDIDDLYKLRIKEKLAAQAIENSIEGITFTDSKGKIVSINKTFTKITKYTEADVLGKPISLLNSGRHDRQFYRNLWSKITTEGHWEGEIWNSRKDGEIFLEWLEIDSIRDERNNITHYVAKFHDLSILKNSENRLHFLAYYDTLTQLPNRSLFNDRLTQAITQSARANKKTVVFFIDLDSFKSINDSLGHDVGDALLLAVAKRLTMLVRKVDTVSRLGGDEFTIIANEMEHQEQVVTLAEKILQAFARPFIINQRKIFTSTSIGIAIYPDDGIDGTELIKHADTAMYSAKEKGRNQYCFYTRKMGEVVSNQVSLERDLREALEHDEFVLHYQPQYNINTGKFCGVEALIRWYHPKRGIIPPTEFIPQAEKCNLIIALGEWVINKACEQGGKWLNEGKQPLRIAINISPKQFQEKGFDQLLAKHISMNHFTGQWLGLEITEQSLMIDVYHMMEMLKSIKSQGISLSIDDFGTGYSSLSYLSRFPIDLLKIDRSFIHDLEENSVHQSIATAIVTMGQGMGVTVLAEGVETEQQKEILQSMGCDEVQGFLYNKPMTAEEISLILE